jgi:hypothetical protein
MYAWMHSNMFKALTVSPTWLQHIRVRNASKPQLRSMKLRHQYLRGTRVPVPQIKVTKAAITSCFLALVAMKKELRRSTKYKLRRVRRFMSITEATLFSRRVQLEQVTKLSAY